MENTETSEQALTCAIEREKEAHAFYVEWAEKVSNPVIQKVFLEFAEEASSI